MTTYYDIDEKSARLANDLNSFYTFEEGKATAEYRAAVDSAAELAEKTKAYVDPIHHPKIDALLDRYARKLAEWKNKYFAIECRCPSVLITGPANFPTHKKEKQNRARESHWREYDKVKGLLDKIQNVGRGCISADDPDALEKLKARLESLENGGGKGRVAWNVAAEKRRIKGRIAELERRNNNPPEGWKFSGGEVVANLDVNRLQIFFDNKPDVETRTTLKSHGFRWAPSQNAWQRQLTNNAIYAARQVCS